MPDRYILTIGAGDWDLPQLEASADAGYRTIATNRDENALALHKADIPVKADGRDIYSILSFLYQNRLEDKIEFVYTGTELFTTAALVAQSVNVKWHSCYSAYVCEHKNLMRSKFRHHNIPHAEGFSASSYEEMLEGVSFRDGMKYIVKPSDSLSAQGVTVIENESEAGEAFNLAMEFSSSKVVVCEEYIEGTLHDANGILTDQGLIRLGTSDKKVGPLPHTVIVELSSPTILEKNQHNEIYVLLEKACRSAGLSNGPVKGDFIMDSKGKIHVMEVAPRLHGPLVVHYLIPEALGISPFPEMIRWAGNGGTLVHDIDSIPAKEIVISASEKVRDEVEGGKIIKCLEKRGLSNMNDWKSNNDVPYYIVWEKERDGTKG